MKDKKFKDTEILDKHFNKGDIIIVTSRRSGTEMGICDSMWDCKYDHDITYDEAVQIHYKNMNKYFPSMNFTLEFVKQSFDPNEKYFITEGGDVRTYKNHEKADAFDLFYLNNDGISKTTLSIIKDKYVGEFGIKQTMYPGDEWPEYRIYDDITDWIKQKIKEYESH